MLCARVLPPPPARTHALLGDGARVRGGHDARGGLQRARGMQQRSLLHVQCRSSECSASAARRAGRACSLHPHAHCLAVRPRHCTAIQGIPGGRAACTPLPGRAPHPATHLAAGAARCRRARRPPQALRACGGAGDGVGRPVSLHHEMFRWLLLSCTHPHGHAAELRHCSGYVLCVWRGSMCVEMVHGCSRAAGLISMWPLLLAPTHQTHHQLSSMPPAPGSKRQARAAAAAPPPAPPPPAPPPPAAHSPSFPAPPPPAPPQPTPMELLLGPDGQNSPEQQASRTCFTDLPGDVLGRIYALLRDSKSRCVCGIAA